MLQVTFVSKRICRVHLPQRNLQLKFQRRGQQTPSGPFTLSLLFINKLKISRQLAGFKAMKMKIIPLLLMVSFSARIIEGKDEII